MKRMAILGLALILSVAACGGSGKKSGATEVQRQADMYAIDQIEKTWHKASSTHNVDLMMSLWAPDATFNVSNHTYTGKAQIRGFFEHKAAPFDPKNNWVSETSAFKQRTTLDGDRGTLYFDCVYVDMKTQKVASIVSADQKVQKIDGKWLITSSVAAKTKLGA